MALLVALTCVVLFALRALLNFDVSGATYGLIAWLRDDINVSTTIWLPLSNTFQEEQRTFNFS